MGFVVLEALNLIKMLMRYGVCTTILNLFVFFLVVIVEF